MRKITRIEIEKTRGRFEGTHGWQVRFQNKKYKDLDVNLFFGDSKYGNSEDALVAAKIFRDAFEKGTETILKTGNLNIKMTSRNTSGFVGIHRIARIDKKRGKTYIRYVWQASWPIAKNKYTKVNFPINRWGEAEAFQKALEARRKGVEDYKASLQKAIKSTPLLELPEDVEIKVWRYMDFTKFVSLLTNKGMFFPTANSFDDPFEGSFSFVNKKFRPLIYKQLGIKHSNEEIAKFFRELKKWICVNCWHMNEYESAGMWSLYSKTEESICIQSTYTKLRTHFDENISMGKVRYVDYYKNWIPENDILSPFFYKRKSYEHERELRATINLSSKKDFNNIKFSGKAPNDGIWIKLDLSLVIDKIYVSPNSTNWFYGLVKNIVDVFKLKIPVVRSSLEVEPFY